MKTMDIGKRAVLLKQGNIRVVGVGESGFRIRLTVEKGTKDAMQEISWNRVAPDFIVDRDDNVLGDKENPVAEALAAAITAGQDLESQINRMNAEAQYHGS